MNPKRIWLQSDEEHAETTWCQDKINDDDVEYIRADEVSRLERIKEAAEKAISWMEESGPGVDELMDALDAGEEITPQEVGGNDDTE